MKELIIVYPNQFGYHTDTYKYCEYLCKYYKISYFCFDQGYEKITMEGVTIYYFPYQINKAKRLFNYFKSIISYSYKYKPAILFVVQFKFSFLLGLVAKAGTKILDFRTGDLTINSSKRKLINISYWFDSLFFKNITVISEGLKRQLYLPKKAFILPLGADSFTTTKHDFTTMKLLYVGTLDNRNIHQTIEGIALFLKKNPSQEQSLSYTIIGFGRISTIQTIESLINKHHLRNNIKFLGKMKYTELGPYFESNNIGISYVPITPYYQFQPATKTFEYAMSGLFVIATKTYENNKVINKNNGILCDDTPESFCNALIEISKNLSNIKEQDVRESLHNYSWKKIVENNLLPYLREHESINCS